jgi:choline dehydrogenase
VFDIAVVGGGAAGCVLATRLAASGEGSVVLLEAGPDMRVDPPPEHADGWRVSRRNDWGYASEPDERGEKSPLRRGRQLGGTSWMTRFAIRGSPADFDEWVDVGNPGWSFDEVLSYFRRLETDIDFGDRAWHGTRGPIPVNRYLDLEQTEALAAAVDAAEAAGFPWVEDLNEPGAIGIGRMPMSSLAGIRTTATAYLAAVGERGNLAIRVDTPIDQVVFDGARAIGVRLVDGTEVHATTVVLSGGTYGSPAILMRSGVGPADHLRELGIEVRADLPGVGANLADHPAVDLDTGYAGPARPAPQLHSIATFHSRTAGSAGAPDLMLWLYDPAVGSTPQMTIDVVLLKPECRGVVRLRSADPADPPLIHLPRPLGDADLDRLAEGYQRALEVAAQPPLRRLRTNAPPAPPATRDELRSLIRQASYSVPHVVGTCAMGPSPTAGAVVDASGRVHGVENLYVADASIIPEPPSGFPHLPTIMLAERLAEVIATA